jgi:hypothetical protein
MTFVTVKLDAKTHAMIKICRDIFLKHHPHTEKHWLSCNKMLKETMKFYIKTEPEFKHLIEGEDEK